MKLYKYLFVAVAVLMSACTESAIDDLTGIYPAPDKYTFTSAVDNGVEKDGKTKKLFNVDFTTTEGDKLSMKFVGDQYFLHPAAFTPAATAAEAKKGNYICEASTFTAKGGSAVKLNRGILTVEKADDNYTVAGSLWLEDGKVIKVNGGGTIVYEPNDPMALIVYKGSQNNGDGTVTAVFSTGTYTEEFDWTTYQTTYVGEGNDLQVKFILPDGKLHAGVYKAGEGYVIGQSVVFSTPWGDFPGDDGTIWYTIANNTKTPQYVISGDIVVEKNGGNYTITLDQGKGGVFAQYEGPLADLDPDGGSGDNFVELNSFIYAADYSMWGGAITLMLGDGNVSVNEKQEWSGTGHYLAVDIKSLEPGVYEANTVGGQLGDGQFGIGYDQEYDYTMWGGDKGVNYDYGTCWWTVLDGERTAQKVLDGTIKVEKNGDTYTLTLESSVINVRYTGPITL